MNNNRFIQDKGRTMAPFPIYPNEVRDENESTGKVKSADQNPPTLVNSEALKFSYSLVASDIKLLTE